MGEMTEEEIIEGRRNGSIMPPLGEGGSAVFSHWATPVTSRKWAVVTVILDTIKRLSGYRVLVHASHRAWEKATEEVQ